MTIWTVRFRSPQNSNQKTRTKMAGTTKVDSQLLEPCIFTSSCLERHSVPSKRNLHCRVCCCRSTTWHWLCMGYGGWSVPICCSPVVPVRCLLREFIEKFWTSNPAVPPFLTSSRNIRTVFWIALASQQSPRSRHGVCSFFRNSHIASRWTAPWPNGP